MVVVVVVVTGQHGRAGRPCGGRVGGQRCAAPMERVRGGPRREGHAAPSSTPPVGLIACCPPLQLSQRSPFPSPPGHTPPQLTPCNPFSLVHNMPLAHSAHHGSQPLYSGSQYALTGPVSIP
ncbi:hypothetical protein E2C01_041873 [Portunus trituberculatus]|uniref:Uncharacterized protein n=1 Tax=Portunus trituberculatus TaxID=210409 RepID=A0A5B7FRV7_PORTR|nr:hypothetical protein [Portunus trituberculatus]